MNRATLKNIGKIILFLFILLFILRSLSYVMRTNGDSKDRFAGFYAEDKNSIDVLMMGSSTVGTSFCSPYMWDRFGFTSYPLSTNSQRPKAIRYLIEEGMKYQKPSLIVVEMRTFIADDEELATDEGHIREVVDNMKYSWHRIKTINEVADHFSDKYTFYVDLFKYHSNTGILAQPSAWKQYNYSVKNRLKGFEIKDRIEQYRKDPTPDVYTEERIAIPQNQEVILKDLLSFLKENNLEALFVASPRADLEDYEGMMNYCSDIVEEAGFKFLNLNYRYKEMEFDYSKDIDDGAHTNVWGALKCSDVLGQYITDNYKLTGSYSEKTKKEWDESYLYFDEQLKNTTPKEKE